MISIQTPVGVYSSRRILQSETEAGNHFQIVPQHKLLNRVSNMLQWIYGILFYGTDEKESLDNLEAFFMVCSGIGLQIHAEKSHWFARQVKFCSRLISSEGVQYYPRHYQSMLDMKKQMQANELQQLLCATNWMRNSTSLTPKLLGTFKHLWKHVTNGTASAINKLY